MLRQRNESSPGMRRAYPEAGASHHFASPPFNTASLLRIAAGCRHRGHDYDPISARLVMRFPAAAGDSFTPVSFMRRTLGSQERCGPTGPEDDPLACVPLVLCKPRTSFERRALRRLGLPQMPGFLVLQSVFIVSQSHRQCCSMEYYRGLAHRGKREKGLIRDFFEVGATFAMCEDAQRERR